MNIKKKKIPSENMRKNCFFFHQCKPLTYTIPWSSRKWNIRIGMTLTENRHFNYFFLFTKVRVLSSFEFQFRYSTNVHLWELILSISLVMEFIQQWVKIKYIFAINTQKKSLQFENRTIPVNVQFFLSEESTEFFWKHFHFIII